MRLKNLTLKNIGPFKDVNLEFIADESEFEEPPVIFFTGENGTGKSIILDAIRALFEGVYKAVERDITSSDDFLIQTDLMLNNEEIKFFSKSKTQGQLSLITNNIKINSLLHSQFAPEYTKNFILDYWTSKLSNDNFDITNISSIEAKTYLDDALSGIHKNVDLTKVIAFFDYLKDSKNDKEKELGKSVYGILEKIIDSSITDGELSHVSRIDLKPIIKIGTLEVSLEKLSSGNLYLIQRLASLLNQVYSICLLNDISISDYRNIKGVLLIDEAENHLHPKWQKVFLENILNLFPKIQILVSTHSPFIISSIKHSRVFVCKSENDHSIVQEETNYYANKPIEEILISPLFNTSNFSTEITALMDIRKSAIEDGNKSKLIEAESKLIEINPEYFDFLRLDQIIKSIKK